MESLSEKVVSKIPTAEERAKTHFITLKSTDWRCSHERWTRKFNK